MDELKSEAVYRSIRAQILAGELPPGTRLVTRALSEEYGTSDIPIREALWMLKRDGLVEIAPYRGASVVVLTPDDVAEIYWIRGHFEALATKTAVPRMADTDLQDMERLLHLMESLTDEDALTPENALRYAHLNRRFHDVIIERSPYPRLRELIRNLWDGNTGLRSVFRLKPERIISSHREHQELLRRIRERDAERAAELTLNHKLAVSAALAEALSRDATESNSLEERA